MSTLRVDRKVFPRTDFPQFGWISTPNPPPPFDPTIEVGGWQLAGSYRSPDRIQDKTYIRQAEVYTDWITGTLGLWEVPYGVGPQAQALSFRVPKRPGLPQDDIEPGWINTPLIPPSFDTTLWPGIEQEVRSFRAADRQQDKTFIRQAEVYTDWITSVLGLWEVPYGVGPQAEMLSYRAREPRTDPTLVRQSAPEIAFLKVPDALWEVYYQVPSLAQALSFRPTARANKPLGEIEIGWVNIPVTVDAVFWPGIEQETRSFRAAERQQDKTYIRQAEVYTDWITGVLGLWEVVYGVGPTAEMLSFRARDRNSDKVLLRRALELYNFFTTLPVFEVHVLRALLQLRAVLEGTPRTESVLNADAETAGVLTGTPRMQP